MAFVVARLLLIALAVSSCSSLTLSSGNFWTCDKVTDKQPHTGPIIKQFNGKGVRIGGVFVSDLQCLGGGDHGLSFIGMSKGKEVIVKMVHDKNLIKERQDHDEMRRALFRKAPRDAPLVPQISEGFTAELPQVYGEVWTKAIGKNFKQIHANGGFGSSKDFSDFAKKSCEAIILLWQIGIRHGDIQRGNLLWNEEKRAVTLVDYESLDDVQPDGEDDDVKQLSDMFGRHRKEIEGYGDAAAAMMSDLKTNVDKYSKSLTEFKNFYERHFTSKTSPKP